MTGRARATALVVGLILGGGPVAAQEPAAPRPEGWNGIRALELVSRARERRQEPLADSLLRNYRADATGHVYFLLDREDAGEPVLLRADQVALELYWAPPSRSKQVIRGMRSEEQFPIRDFAYYLDRYTVIQNGFGDEIRVGEGRDVADVLHPLAPGAGATYDYRLADSTTIRLPGRPEPLRVYEIQVRPRDFGIPAIVGSLFLERARGDLVRLAFTFTPSAYLDPRNERVEIVLENALWEDRYWLPREQRLLVRREIPELDIDVGTVIRAVLQVTDYELNADIPRGFFAGQPVIVAAGPDGLAAYPFDTGLYDGLDDVGLAPGAEAGTLDAVDVDAIAGRILRERFLRGVPRVRFHAPNASAVLRFDRAEGLVTGAGLAYGIGEHQLTAYVARAWGGRWFAGELALRPLPGSDARFSAEAFHRRPADGGLRPAAAGVVSSIAAATLGEDYRDLHFESGIAVGRQLRGGAGTRTEIALSAERHSSAEQVVERSPLVRREELRPVIPIDDGDLLTLAFRDASRRDAPLGGRRALRLEAEVGWLRPDDGDDRFFGVLSAEAADAWRGHDLRWGLDTRLSALATFDAPAQLQPLVGGRNTLPGHPLRAYRMRNGALGDAEAWLTVVPRWIRIRALAAGAFIGQEEDTDLAASLGVGLGFIDGVLRLDWARGFGGAPHLPPDPDGVLILSIDPRLWPFL